MINNKFTKKSISGLLLLIVIGIVVFICLPKNINIKLSNKKNNTPDWYMTEVTSTTYNSQGLVKGILLSPKVTHHPLTNTIELTRPNLTLYDSDRVPWHITSLNGRIYQSQANKVHLWNNVIIQQMPGPHSDSTTISTNKLTYYPKTSFAHTNQPVTITQSNSEMQSVGIDADLKKGLIHFLSQSHIEYDDSD
ncbi:MAG: LPS export ABC transporter periplasmic protein LptC [Gammaproteobacteria bacterium RIFCSPHIGHO2_12_FULL_35_23]|nr:MAG: LPS export ABC transporter periplasmic protein LptC [Gammaproteobacteria bacterium RIFCSPHIGHO2_12_FULL_35_23]